MVEKHDMRTNSLGQLFGRSVLAGCISALLYSPAYAGPEGGDVKGGAGSITKQGNVTTILQQTDRMAINWQSYNVDSNERVEYVQPDASSISLNRILSNSGSDIQGRIDANGQVILVNPHGIIFGRDSVVNAGGILASGLDIDPGAFMNGEFTFKAIDGTEASIVNEGLLSAATGGSVSLIGKSINNTGVVSAELGSVNFAAGREAVVTFGASGNVGVRISEALLENDIGVDSAIVNSGDIRSEGGKVLLTASTSRDIFSQAVNVGEMQQDNSVVFNEDGTYTLGAGADVTNVGSIDVSGSRAGEIAILGETITQGGVIRADGDMSAGSIELHSRQATVLIESSVTSASSVSSHGGDVKLLGEHVGVFGTSRVVADGATGGGQILLGGDQRGENELMRNAVAAYAGRETEISASVSDNNNGDGDGGKVVLWADDYLRVYGNLSAVGNGGGRGGFIETSSAVVDLDPNVDVSGGAGLNGQWLIDPYNVTIGPSPVTDPAPTDIGSPSPRAPFTGVFTPSSENSFLTVAALRTALVNDGNVLVETTGGGDEPGNITVTESINYNGRGNSSLTLQAHNDININENIFDSDQRSDRFSLTLTANFDGGTQDGGGNINIADAVSITTQGGSFIATGANFTNNGFINVASVDGGGNIDINMSGAVSLGAINFGDLDGGNDNFAQTVSFDVRGSSINVNGDLIYGENDNNQRQVINASFVSTSGDIIFDDVLINNEGDGANVLNLSLTSESDTGDFIIRDTDVTNDDGTTIFLTGGNLSVNGGRNFTIEGALNGGVTRVGTQGGAINVGAVTPLAGNFDAAPLLADGSLDTSAELHSYSELFGVDLVGDIVIDVAGSARIGSMLYTGNDVGDWDYSGSEDFNFTVDAGENIFVSTAGIAIDRYTGTGSNSLRFTADGDIQIDGAIAHALDNTNMTFNSGLAGFENNSEINTGSGFLTVTSGGAITAAGNFIVGGLTSLASGGDINVANNGNVFGEGTTAISLNSGGSATIFDNSPLYFGDSTIAGDLIAESGNQAIYDSGTLNVTGTSTFTVADDFAVLLDNASNDFVGAVSSNGVWLELNDINDLVIGNLNLGEQIAVPGNRSNTNISAGGAITQISGGAITTRGGALTVSGTSVQTGALSTAGGQNQNGGRISISASAGDVATGVIDTSGGVAVASGSPQDGPDAGEVIITAAGGITATSISAVGADSADNSNANNADEFRGGNGADVSLRGININVGSIVIDGGQGIAQENNDNGDDANGGDAGNIVIGSEAQPASVVLGGSFSARGGRFFERRGTPDAINGVNGQVQIFGDVDLASTFSINTTLSERTNGSALFSENAAGNVTISGSITSDADANTENFTVNGGDISLGNIFTRAQAVGADGGAVRLNGTRVAVGAIDTRGADATGAPGGAGGILLVNVDNDIEARFTLNGAIDTRGGAGSILGAAGAASVSLISLETSGSGVLDLSGAEIFGSNVTITGTASNSDTLIGPDLSPGDPDTFVVWQTSASGNSLGNSEIAPGVARFSGFETLTGGDGVDIFTLNAAAGRVNGGGGDDVFNIFAGVVLPIFGNGGDDTVALRSTAAGEYSWTVSGPGAGELSDGANFQSIEILLGADTLGGNDVFRLNGDFGADNTIDAGLGNDRLLVTDSTNPTQISFEGDVTGILNLETLRAEGDANNFTLQLIGESLENNWTIDGTNSGRVSDAGSAASEVRFENFATVIGNVGADSFVFESTGSIRRIDGNAGEDRVDLRALNAPIHVEILEGTLGAIAAVPADRVRVADAEWIYGDTGSGASPIRNEITLLSASTHQWDFSNFDASGTDVDGLRDAQLTRIAGNGSVQNTLNIVDFDVFNGGSGQDTFVVGQAGVNVTVSGGGGTDTLQGFDANNVWRISDGAIGNRLSYVLGTESGVIDFSDVENLSGSNDFSDTFSFFGDADISGNINAGEATVPNPAAPVIDTVDYALSNTPQDLSVGGSVNGITGVERVIGSNAGTNILRGSTTFADWEITGTDSGEVFNTDRSDSLEFVNFENLVGGSDADVFTLLGGNITDIDGGGGDDQISGGDVGRAWRITGDNMGLVGPSGNVVGRFSGIELLAGAESATDTFVIEASGNYNGEIRGGASAGDRLEVQSTSANSDATWRLAETNLSVSRDGNTVNFSGIDALLGGAGRDVFRLNPSLVTPDFTVDAGGGDNDQFDLQDFGADDGDLLASVQASGNSIAFTRDTVPFLTINNIESVRGNNQSNLRFQSNVVQAGASLANSWTIDNVNDGRVVVGARTINFENVANLVGGANSDTFTVAGDGRLNGTIDAVDFGTGTNRLIWQSDNLEWRLNEALYTGTVNATTRFSNIQRIDGGENNTLFGPNLDSLWSVTGRNGGVIQNNFPDPDGGWSIRFEGFANLLGNRMIDRFAIGTTGSVSGVISGTFNDLNDNVGDSLRLVNGGGDVLWNLGSATDATARSVERGDETIVQNFSRIEILVSGDGNDSANIWDFQGITSINLGDSNARGRDTLTWSDNNDSLNWIIGADNAALGSSVNDGSGVLNFAGVEDLTGSGGDNGNDSFDIQGAAVGVVRGAGGNDNFTITTAEELDIILLGGGGGNDTLTATNANNIWFLAEGNIDNRDELVGTLNANDASPGVRFSRFENIVGGNQRDTFTVDSASARESINIDGSASVGTDTDNVLIVLNAANSGRETQWQLQGENQGQVNLEGISEFDVDFSNIQNLTGSAGRDRFTIAGGTVTGLLDGGENSDPDAIDDTLDIGGLLNAVVVVGEEGGVRPLIEGAEDFFYVNAWGMELYQATDETPETNENNRWIVLNRTQEMQWRLAENRNGTNTGTNSGTVVEVLRSTSDPDEAPTPIAGTRFFFNNFGSAQGSTGADAINDPDDNLTGTWNPSTGGQRLIYRDATKLSLVYLTPDILSVEGNGGNVILAIAPDGSIDDVNLNGANDWLINGSNAGTFTASYFTVGDGDDVTPFSFTFSGVNRIEGGTGSDIFTFSGAGDLINGYIAGGGGTGQDRINILANSSAALDFGLSFRRIDPTSPDINFPQLPGLPALFELNNRDGVVDIAGIQVLEVASRSAATSSVSLRSADTGNFRWGFDGSLVDTDNNVTLTYSGIDSLRGGGANDTFMLNEDTAISGVLDGGEGTDTVNLSALDLANVQLGETAAQYRSIEAFVGNGTTSVIQGADASNLWTINGLNQGEVNYDTLDVSFSGFTEIIGGAGSDIFTIDAGTVSGSIRGGLGDDELNVMLGFTDTGATAPGPGGASGNLRFIGGEGEDSASFSGGSAATRFDGIYTVSAIPAALSQTFSYTIDQAGAAQTSRVTLEGVNDVDEQVYTNSFVINDVESQSDTIRVAANSFTVGSFNEIGSRNNRSLTLAADAQDQVLIDGPIMLDGSFRVDNAGILTGGDASRIVAGESVRFVGISGIGSAEGRLAIETGALFLDALRGDAFFDVTGDIDLAQISSPTGLVDVMASGSISDSGALSSISALNLTSGANIVLDNANNVSGILSLIATGDITLSNGVTRLGEVRAQNLTINTQSSVEDSGPIVIANATTINAAPTSAVILDGADNQFNLVEVNNAGSLLLVDSSDDGLSVGGSAGDAFTVSARGNLNSNAIDADAIALTSTNGFVATRAGLSARNSVALIGNGVMVDDVVSVSTGIAGTAISIDARGIEGSAQEQTNINASLLANGTATGDIEIWGAGLNQAIGAQLQGRNINLNSTGDLSLAANINASGDLDILADGSITMNNGAAPTQTQGQSVSISAGESILTRALVADTLRITSDNGNITQQGDINTTTATLSALNGEYGSLDNTTLTLAAGESALDAQSAQLDGDIAGNGTLVMRIGQDFVQNGNIAAASVNADVGGQIVMAPDSRIVTRDDVSLSAGQRIALAEIVAGQGNDDGAVVSLTTGGAIEDNNAAAVNVSANTLIARSETGFGGGGDGVTATQSIETAVANIDVLNDSGGIGVINTGELNVNALRSNSDVNLFNRDGNVTLVNDLDRVYDLNTDDAREAGGVINANYDFGTATVSVPNGFLNATGAAFNERPELVGDFVEVATSGGFGVRPRQLVVYARTLLFVDGPGIRPLWAFNRPPANGIETTDELLESSSVTSVSELLVEVEDIQDVDPAVFTDVRNYALDNISIRMPRDQIYDDEDDEDDEEGF